MLPQRSSATMVAPRSRLALWTVRVTVLDSPRMTRSGSATRDTRSAGRQAALAAAASTATTAAVPTVARSGYPNANPATISATPAPASASRLEVNVG